MKHEPACTGTKTCKRCGRSLPCLSFAASPDNRDGLSGTCRDCTASVALKTNSRLATKKMSLAKKLLAAQMSVFGNGE